MYIKKDQCKTFKKNDEIIYYPRSSIPLISEYLKNSLTIFLMSTIYFLQILEFKLFTCNPSNRSLLLRNLLILFFYVIIKLINSITSFYIYNSDFLLIIFIISSMTTFNEMLNKFILIIFKSKEILIFWFMMILTFACLSRILFFDIKEFNSGKTFYYNYNFDNFHSTLYSMLILISLNNFPMSMLHAYKINKLYFLFFFLYIIFNTILIINMITAVFNYNFSSLYKKYIKFMNKPDQKNLKKKIKIEIHLKRLNNNLLMKILNSHCRDKYNNFKDLEIDYYFQNIKDKILNQEVKDNINIYSKLLNLRVKNRLFIIIFGIIDLLCVIITLISIDYYIYNIHFILILVLSLIILFEQMLDIFILFNNFELIFRKILSILDLLLNFIIIFINIFFMIINENDFANKYSNLLKLLNILNVLRIKRFVKFFFWYKEIKYILKIFFKILKFLIDLIFILIMLYFIFSSFSLSFFGGLVNNKTIVKYKDKFNSDMTESQLVWNFNDYINSYFTLDYIRKTGWIETMMINLVNKKEENYINIYFFVWFFFIMNFCLYPIITGFILDNLFSYLSDIINKKDASDINIIKNNFKSYFDKIKENKEDFQNVDTRNKNFNLDESQIDKFLKE